jgi:uncharacterized membrane protein YdjX (TVP38/TMEM64 family)
MQISKNHKSAIIKAAVLVAFITVAVSMVHFSPAKGYCTAHSLGHFLKVAGFWAPLAYVVVFAVGVCMFVPYLLLTTVGAALFGVYWGFLYVVAGAMAGASASFWISRGLGREFVTLIVGDRFKPYLEGVERNGFATVLYLRLLYLPFAPLNFAMGLTNVRFWDYFWGTGVAISLETFIFTLLIGTIKEAWIESNWYRLFSPQFGIALALFTVSLFIPKIISKLKQRCQQQRSSAQQIVTRNEPV